MPATTNRKMSIPNTGADVGTWGSADLNPNFSILDGILGSVTVINLTGSSGTTSLTDAQQQVAVIRLTGVLTANCNVQFSEAGFWIVENLTSGNFVATLGVSGSIENTCTPQGSRYQIFVDTSIPGVRTVTNEAPGEFKRFCTSTIPLWMSACTVIPWLPCRGGTQLISSYPALFNLIGTQFGGNGSTTFGIPDLQGRDGYDLDNGAGRLTSASMTPNGNTIGATGGDERLQNHSHAWNPITQTWNSNETNVVLGGPLSVTGPGVSGVQPTTFTHTTVQVTPNGSIAASSFGGGGNNMPPSIVLGTTFIKT